MWQNIIILLRFSVKSFTLFSKLDIDMETVVVFRKIEVHKYVCMFSNEIVCRSSENVTEIEKDIERKWLIVIVFNCRFMYSVFCLLRPTRYISIATALLHTFSHPHPCHKMSVDAPATHTLKHQPRHAPRNTPNTTHTYSVIIIDIGNKQLL